MNRDEELFVPMSDELDPLEKTQEPSPLTAEDLGAAGIVKPSIRTIIESGRIRVGQTFEVNGIGLEVRKITNKDIVCRPAYLIYEP